MGRKIIHVDMDAFFASVEARERPELRGKPLVVGGDPRGRGVVASASYEARRYGIRSAMSCRKAMTLCPHAVFVPPHFELYREVSDTIHEIFLEVTPLVEPLSLDEAYLDVTENKLNEPLARRVAQHLKSEILRRTGLTASAGVGPNKFIAKVASDLKKPDGLVVIPPEKVLIFVERLPVDKLWGVGPATAKRLHEMGLRTAGDIRNCSREELEKELGRFGTFLHELSFGRDTRTVDPFSEAKSRGSETTFEKDVLDLGRLTETLREQAREIAESIAELNCLCRNVTIKVRYADFKTITRSRTLYHPTNRWSDLFRAAEELLTQGTEAGQKPVRLIGLSAAGFVRPEDPLQLWLDLPE